jgi:hypothetical protein
MAATPSTMLALRTVMPEFELRDFDGRWISSSKSGVAFGTLVVFCVRTVLSFDTRVWRLAASDVIFKHEVSRCTASTLATRMRLEARQ